VVFSSSLAVYGGEVPDPITDHSFLNPQTSYGMEKAVGELLVNDYSRRGLIDGRGFRLPTISVRPGAPNKAASGFMSSIFREPLQGKPALCPVGRDYAHYYLSPRRCVENLILGTDLPAQALGQNRCMIMPGRTWTVGQMIDAMTEVAGPAPARLIDWTPQPEVARIVMGWRSDLRADRALGLGLRADDSFADNIRAYLEDDHPTSAAPISR
jgi:nucleoside-diphosphate-sugar epimerase